MSRYDSRTTIFSPEGRLFQVEYAMEAIQHAGTALGIVSSEGCLLVAEKRVTSTLLDTAVSHPQEKLYALHEDAVCCVAGLTADAHLLIQVLRVDAQRHLLVYGEHKPLEQLVQSLCDTKQSYTQYGGKRPFGVSFLYAGYDRHYGFQLYQSDPSGNYGGWQACCVGANASAAQSLLKADYKPELTMDESIRLALKILCKTMDAASLSSEKLELATLTRVNGKVVQKMWTPAQIEPVLKEIQAQLAAAAQQEKAQQQQQK